MTKKQPEKPALRIEFISQTQAAKMKRADLVPAYRIRHGQRKFMLWAKRDENLRGVEEIRFEGDQVGGNGEMVLVRSKSDA